jgi:hypothetical protein
VHIFESTQGNLRLRVTRDGRVAPFVAGVYQTELAAWRTVRPLQLGDTAEGIFSIEGQPLPRAMTVGEAGLKFLHDNVNMFASYQVRLTGPQKRQTLQLGFSFPR